MAKEMTERQIFLKAISGKARFIPLNQDKSPTGPYRGIENQRNTTPPKNKVYGVLLKDDIFVIDIDCKTGSVEEQLVWFEEILGFSRKDTFCVETQTGGLHVYLRTPKGVNGIELGCGSIRPYSEALDSSCELDSDLRGPDTNSFVVGPGSSVKFKESHIHSTYIIPDWCNPNNFVEVKSSGFKLLKNRKRIKNSLDKKDKARRKKVKHPKIEVIESNGFSLDSISRDQISHLRNILERRNFEHFHRARLFTWAALSCCHDLNSIAAVCRELGIAVNSSKENKIMSDGELLQDLERIHQKFSVENRRHGFACGKVNSHGHKDSEEKRRAKVKSRSISRSLKNRGLSYNRVISLELVREKLSESVKSMKSQQVRDSLLLVESHLQPLANCGAERFVLARSELAKVLELSESRIAQAIRILVKSDVIRVQDKQRKGFAATFKVSTNVIDQKKTRFLRELADLHRVEDINASFVFHDVGGVISFEGVNVGVLAKVQNGKIVVVEDSPKSKVSIKAYDVAFRYSRKEREARFREIEEGPRIDPMEFLGDEEGFSSVSLPNDSFDYSCSLALVEEKSLFREPRKELEKAIANSEDCHYENPFSSICFSWKEFSCKCDVFDILPSASVFGSDSESFSLSICRVCRLCDSQLSWRTSSKVRLDAIHRRLQDDRCIGLRRGSTRGLREFGRVYSRRVRRSGCSARVSRVRLRERRRIRPG